MRVRVESWAPEFGSALVSDDDLVETTGEVDVGIELPAERWRPLRPARTAADEVLFVDGVRRIDARVWLETDDQPPRLGLCVSYAAGVVRCRTDAAAVEEVEVRRRLVAPGGPPALRTALATYEPVVVASDDLESLIGEVQQQLGAAETAVVRRAAPAVLVVVDGPLTGRQDIPGAVGYIKSHRVAYLPEAAARVVAELAAGERTPLFVTQTSWSRYSWYLRLPGGGGGHPWAGVVRCELPADRSLSDAVAVADLVTATLPRYASQPHRDPRAPQNLHPIAGLERQLRHRLGDPHLLLRALRAAVS